MASRKLSNLLQYSSIAINDESHFTELNGVKYVSEVVDHNLERTSEVKGKNGWSSLEY
jgi:hypothetical protein